eukprot:2635003-Rhodomonas_salina.2
MDPDEQPSAECRCENTGGAGARAPCTGTCRSLSRRRLSPRRTRSRPGPQHTPMAHALSRQRRLIPPFLPNPNPCILCPESWPVYPEP